MDDFLAAVPHRLMQDDEYDGHVIPKGTMVSIDLFHCFEDTYSLACTI